MNRLCTRVLPLAMALVGFVQIRDSRAACVDGTVWSGPLPMPILLNVTIDDDLCPGSSCSVFDEIRITSEKAMNQWYLETGSTFRMSYAGTTTAARQAIIADNVHVFANPCTGGTLGVAAWDVNRTWGKIRMCINNDNAGTINWQTDALDNTGSQYSYQNVFGAELAHIVGMKHTEDCASPVKSISSADYERDLSHLFQGDFDFLQSQFGVRTNVDHVRTTTDGITWVNGLTGPAEADDAQGRFTASNSLGGAKSFISFIDVDPPHIVYTSKYDTTWTMLASPLFASSPYHTGIASASDTDARVQFLGGYNTSTGLTSVYEAPTTNGGTSWGASTVISDAGTQSHTTMDGVNSTYDPATGQYIRVWRGGYNVGSGITHTHEIFYKIGTNPVQRVLDSLGNPYLASDTPSVACGTTAVVGSQNCLLAWTDGKSWYRTVKWFQASVNGSGVFVPSSLKTHNFISLATASVAYGGDATYPWEIVLNQGGTTSYSWRKGPLSTASFQDQRSFSDSPKAMAPTLGSRISGATRYAISIIGNE